MYSIRKAMLFPNDSLKKKRFILDTSKMQIVSSKGQIIQYMHAVKVMLQLTAQSAKD